MRFTPQELLEMAKENGDRAALHSAGRRAFKSSDRTVAMLIAAYAKSEIMAYEAGDSEYGKSGDLTSDNVKTLQIAYNEAVEALKLWPDP